MTCNGSSADNIKESNQNGHTHEIEEEVINAKYMRCLEEPYKYHTQVPGKAVSKVS